MVKPDFGLRLSLAAITGIAAFGLSQSRDAQASPLVEPTRDPDYAQACGAMGLGLVTLLNGEAACTDPHEPPCMIDGITRSDDGAVCRTVSGAPEDPFWTFQPWE